MKPRTPLPIAGIVVLLHGFLSTDLGTFDGFIKKWRNPNPKRLPLSGQIYDSNLVSKDQLTHGVQTYLRNNILFVGWPHDTLTAISQNALDLAKLIDIHIGRHELLSRTKLGTVKLLTSRSMNRIKKRSFASYAAFWAHVTSLQTSKARSRNKR